MTDPIDPDSNEAILARHRRTHAIVHPDVAKARRDEIEREQARIDDTIRSAAIELTAGLDYVDRICIYKVSEVSYEALQRSGFKRPGGWNRKYSLADARSHARIAAMRLRTAWELLDPISKEREEAARRTVLCNAQEQLQTAIGHLQKVLNGCRSADEQMKADTAARAWLASIGSEPN